MQLVGGALGATVGFFIGGPVGANAGWLIGGWLGGLLSPNSTKTGPDPAAMPSFNQSLRGTPIFMTFGANRVSSQIVWSKNYTPVRHSSGGKGGKGGGSGGMGSAKGGGSAGYYYTYTWDLAYHFGMVDQPSYLRTAWIGGDRVNKTNLATWQSNFPLFTSSTLLDSSHSPSAERAEITAAEYHYNGGLPTGDGDLQTWSYFTAQEGNAVAWPYTCWLGFKTMELGQSPAVPQLTVELVPVGSTITESHAFVNDQTDAESDVNVDFFNGQSFVIANSKHWKCVYRMGGATNAFGLFCVEDETQVYLPETTFNVDSPVGASWDARMAFGVPGTPYIYVDMADLGSDGHFIFIYKLNDDETITLHDITTTVLRHSATGITMSTSNMLAVGLVNNQVYAAIESGTSSIILEFGTLGIAPNGDGSDGYWNTVIVRDLTGTVGTNFFLDFTNHSSRTSQTAATFVDDGAGGYRLLLYAGRPEIAGTMANTILLSLAGAHPNGFTVDETGTLVFDSFDDIGLHADGSSGASVLSDYISPSYVVLSGTHYLIWCRMYKDAVDVGTHGNMFHVRVMEWDGNSQIEISSSITHLFEDGTDLGVDNSGGVAFPRGVQFYMDADGTIWYDIFYQGAGTPITARYIMGTYASTAQSGSEDVTPPYIIYRILTSDVFGVAVAALFGFSVHSGRIDSASYNAAVALCESQGIKIAVTYTNQDDVLNIFNALLSLYAGYLVEIGGTIYFGMAQDTDDTGVTVDNRHLISTGPGKPPVATTNPAIQDGYNQIQYNYVDRLLDYKNNQIELSDEVDIDINGPRPKQFAPRFVMPGSLAQMEAERALWANLYGRATRTFKLGWNRSYLIPGDVFTLVDSFDTLLQAGVKVRMVRKKESKRGAFDVTVVDHIPYQITANHSFSNVTDYNPPGDYITSPAPADFRMYEVPKEFQGALAKTYVGYNQHSAVMGAQLHLSGDGTNFIQVADVQPFCISGIIRGDLPKRPPGWVEKDVHVYLMPASPFDANTPTYVQTHALDDVTQAVRAAGGGNILVGSEIIAIEGVNLVGVNHYRISRMYRGWGGTPISAVTSGQQWHYHGSGIFNHEITEDDIGSTLWYKVVPYNFAGQAYNIASIDARTYSILGLYWLPRFQPAMTVYATSRQIGTSSQSLIDRYHAVFSGDGVTGPGTNLQFTWPPAANNEGYGAGGYGAGGYGHFAADITSPTYRVDVLSNNAHAVSSFFVSTGFFEYTQNQNSTDFAGFAHNLIFQVTPYTVKGDGPVADVRSISLIW